MHDNVIQKMEECDKGDGYFITVSILKEGQLTHYQRQQNFAKEDLLPSVGEIKKLVMRGMD